MSKYGARRSFIFDDKRWIGRCVGTRLVHTELGKENGEEELVFTGLDYMRGLYTRSVKTSSCGPDQVVEPRLARGSRCRRPIVRAHIPNSILTKVFEYEKVICN